MGPYYTLVLETTYPNLSEYEKASTTAMSNEDWRRGYQRFTPHVESGYREVFTIVQ